MPELHFTLKYGETEKKELKKNIIAFINLGLMTIILGVFMFFGFVDIPVNNDVWCAAKLILITLSGIVVVIGIVTWDIIAGINLIEQKLNVIEGKTTKLEGDNSHERLQTE